MTGLHVLQVTDTHLLFDTSIRKNGIIPANTLAAVLDAALVQNTPDLLLATGDLAQDPVEQTYRMFESIVRERYAGPMIAIPGNHDSGELMEELFPNRHEMGESWTVAGIDTHIDGEVAGHVGEESLNGLKSWIEGSEGHFLLIGHHPIADIGSAWLDAHRVDNGEQVVELLEENAAARAYLCGHIHQECDYVCNGVRYLATPSTCWQFAPDTSEFGFDDKPPGWRWLLLQDDGSIETVVFRLESN